MPGRLETKCVHVTVPQNPERHYGAISYPIYQTATFAHPAGQSTGYDYSRLQNPTREQLERQIAQLEHGNTAFALSSGMAALDLLLRLFHPGDHIIMDTDLYGGSVRLVDHVAKPAGLEVTSLDCCREDIEPHIRDNTVAVYVETPTNPMMNVIDIAALAETTSRRGLLLIVDNTFLSPYLQTPLDLGADIVLHSGTKFLGGHNDTIAGFLAVRDEVIAKQLRFLLKTVGSGLAPWDSWLILRGIKTLALRMERAGENAQKLAAWLAQQPAVARVIYPGLSSHPGRSIMLRQARGFGSMITFQVRSREQALGLLRKVQLIQFAESLGGVETLLTHPATQTHADIPEEVRMRNGITDCTLRLSVGIENVDDLIDDLEQAFRALETEYGTQSQF